MQNNVNSNISWYEGHTITSLGKILKFSKFYVQYIWQVVRWWHHQLTHLHIHIDWSRNVLWKFAKLQSVITSLFFNRFSSGFHCYVWNFLLFLLSLTLKGPGGGGIRPPLDVSRDNFAKKNFRAASFHDFFLSSFAQLLALFSEKSGVWFESYATLCTRASAQNLKIFWICVQNIWKMASCAKTPFWALKCNICIHYS